MPNRKSTHQYLTFQLDAEWYAIEVSRIEEVLEYQSITRVPKMPESMRGVINVRGNIVPIVDLRYKFSLPISEATVNTESIEGIGKINEKFVVIINTDKIFTTEDIGQVAELAAE